MEYFFFFFFMLSYGSSPLIFFTFSPFDEKILDIGKKSYSSITIKQTGAYCFSEWIYSVLSSFSEQIFLVSSTKVILWVLRNVLWGKGFHAARNIVHSLLLTKVMNPMAYSLPPSLIFLFLIESKFLHVIGFLIWKDSWVGAVYFFLMNFFLGILIFCFVWFLDEFS